MSLFSTLPTNGILKTTVVSHMTWIPPYKTVPLLLIRLIPAIPRYDPLLDIACTSPSRYRGLNASNPARGRTLPGQERPSNGRPDASQRRPGSMLCPVGLPGALSVDILALLLYWPTYAPITEGQIGINMTFSVKKKCFLHARYYYRILRSNCYTLSYAPFWHILIFYFC